MWTCTRRWLLLAIAVVASTPFAAEAAEPLSLTAARTRVLIVRKGDPEVVNFGTLDNTADVDHFVVLLLGTGTAKLTVSDADATGDTISASGSLNTKFPATFDVSATSPDSIVQPLLVTTFGVLQFDVQYDAIVNVAPANYIYRLKF